jgi:hypothetical protein
LCRDNFLRNSDFSRKDVSSEAFVRPYSAYLLFYERVNPLDDWEEQRKREILEEKELEGSILITSLFLLYSFIFNVCFNRKRKQ